MSESKSKPLISPPSKGDERTYTVIRGTWYDITDFMGEHPGGRHMLAMAVGRDSTVLYESHHLRQGLADKMLETIPKCNFESDRQVKFDAFPDDVPTPGQSELYQAIRNRIKDEVFGGKCARGVPAWRWLLVIVSAISCGTWFVLFPSVLVGFALGACICWIGVGVMHTANHGGLTRNPCLGYLLGLLDDLGGGSSLIWRYHHNVMHHTVPNDLELDMDVFSSFPLVRLDSRFDLHWYHRFQFLYTHFISCFMYFSIQIQDWTMIYNRRTHSVHHYGNVAYEVPLAVALKCVHYGCLFGLPWYLHGFSAMVLPWIACFCGGGFILATAFLVSHNVQSCKEVEKYTDWAVMQIETAVNWGGCFAAFFMGGLNLQIEHHLFPGMAHSRYPAIRHIVEEECEKRGVRYNKFSNLFMNWVSMVRFLYDMGRAAPTKA